MKLPSFSLGETLKLTLMYQSYNQTVVIDAMARFRKKTPKKTQLGKHMKKMLSATEKGRIPESPPIRSRQDVITDLFGAKMEKIGLEPSSDSGHIPLSYTPLARLLLENGVQDEIISAILQGLQQEKNEQAVRDIIEAISESPDVSLEGTTLAEAQRLAVEEWKRLHEAPGA